jgi:hypothetical protein
MEKLLEFKKGKHPWEDENYLLYRFQCDCLSPSDAMDIDVESCGKNDEDKFITIRLDFRGTSFWDRVRYAAAILKGDWTWREFIPRREDYPNLAEIFSDKKYSELP